MGWERTVRVVVKRFFLPTSNHPLSPDGASSSFWFLAVEIDRSSSSSVSRKKPKNSSASSWCPIYAKRG